MINSPEYHKFMRNTCSLNFPTLTTTDAVTIYNLIRITQLKNKRIQLRKIDGLGQYVKKSDRGSRARHSHFTTTKPN